jgi:hypothetical protein
MDNKIMTGQIRRNNYPTDLSEKEWLRIRAIVSLDYKLGGRPCRYSKIEILNDIFYVMRTIKAKI